MKKAPKYFTLIIVPSREGKVRRLIIPRVLVTGAIIGVIIGAFFLFYFVNQYKINKERLVYLEKVEELAQIQQQKISLLAEKVLQFEQTLEKLRETEEKLKNMVGAGGESKKESQESFGQGGPERYILSDKFPAEKDYLSLTIDRIEDSFKHLREEAKQTEKNFIRMQEVIIEKKAIFSSTPNIFPVRGWISAGYGWRTNPFTGRREMHEAIDIVAPWGTPVKATCEGRVTYAGWKDFYGLMIKIENGYGYSTVYARLSKILIRKGDKVEKGQVIGRVGSSGRSTGPHLHYEVWKGDKTINPLELIVEPLE